MTALSVPELLDVLWGYARNDDVCPEDPCDEVAQALLIVVRRGGSRAVEEITGHKYETISERPLSWFSNGGMAIGAFWREPIAIRDARANGDAPRWPCQKRPL